MLTLLQLRYNLNNVKKKQEISTVTWMILWGVLQEISNQERIPRNPFVVSRERTHRIFPSIPLNRHDQKIQDATVQCSRITSCCRQELLSNRYGEATSKLRPNLESGLFLRKFVHNVASLAEVVDVHRIRFEICRKFSKKFPKGCRFRMKVRHNTLIIKLPKTRCRSCQPCNFSKNNELKDTIGSR